MCNHSKRDIFCQRGLYVCVCIKRSANIWVPNGSSILSLFARRSQCRRWPSACGMLDDGWRMLEVNVAWFAGMKHRVQPEFHHSLRLGSGRLQTRIFPWTQHLPSCGFVTMTNSFNYCSTISLRMDWRAFQDNTLSHEVLSAVLRKNVWWSSKHLAIASLPKSVV